MNLELETSAGAPATAPRSAVAGYLSEAYARSLGEHGEPLFLPRSRAWLLVRAIPSSERRDAMGLYPLLCCGSWPELEQDLAVLPAELVSLCLVADPFGSSPELLERLFGGSATPFKEAYIVDLDAPLEESASRHHRYYARRALRSMEVALQPADRTALEEWIQLYQTLIERHAIGGISAFSPRAFERQFEVPGLMVLRAHDSRETLGMQLWFLQGDIAYHHLSAYSPAGYRRRASYALLWSALLELRARGLRHAYLGGGAGLERDEHSGLEAFKRGWSNATRTVYLCRKILDRDAYEHLVARTGTRAASYFPRYRAGEPR